MSLLKVAVCNGSLGPRLIEFLKTGGYQLKEPDRTGSLGTSNGIEFVQVDRRMVPQFIRDGEFDAGVTGYDLLLASNFENDLRVMAKLCFSRASDVPTRWALVAKPGYQLRPHSVIGCELPSLVSRIVPGSHHVSLKRIEGSEELCVKYGIVEAALVVVETGSSLRACGLEIVAGFDNLLESVPCLMAKQVLSDEKEKKLNSLSLTLQAVVGASQFAMVTFNLPATVGISTLSLPCDTAPTINPTSNLGWVEVSICIPRSKFPDVVGSLRAAGATGIVLLPVTGHLA